MLFEERQESTVQTSTRATGSTASAKTKSSSSARTNREASRGSGKRIEDVYWHNVRMARAAKSAFRNLIEEGMRKHPRNSQYLCIRVSLKQAMRNPENGWIDLTREQADRAMKVGCDRVNIRLFGKAYKKGRRKLWIVDCHEGGNFVRQHRHLLVCVPEDQCPQLLGQMFVEKLMRLDWTKQSHGAHQHGIKVELAKSPCAVMRYITKTGADSISLDTSTL